MKAKAFFSRSSSDIGNHRDFLTYPIGLCRKAIVLIQDLKTHLLSEFANKRQENQHLVRLALNEAEALAWETDYPYLFFPTLAAEKVETIVNWERHQQLIRRAESQMAYAC